MLIYLQLKSYTGIRKHLCRIVSLVPFRFLCYYIMLTHMGTGMIGFIVSGMNRGFAASEDDLQKSDALFGTLNRSQSLSTLPENMTIMYKLTNHKIPNANVKTWQYQFLTHLSLGFPYFCL